MMRFPVRKCNFVLRYILLLVLTSVVMFVLFQANTSTPRLSKDVISFHVKTLRNSQIFVTPQNYHSGHVTARTAITHPKVHNETAPTVKSFVTEQDVNNHNYDYIVNPSTLCDGTNVYIMIYVHSAPANFKKRMSIRETWGFQRFLNEFDSRIVFVLGKVANRATMMGVQLEYNQYGDIVQEDFVDSYRNLTHKAIGALKWVKHFCGHAKYMLKADDDILVNMYHLMNYIHKKLESESKVVKNLLLCNRWVSMKVIRNDKSKWFLSKDEFSLDRFPPYCSGSAFLMSRDVVHKLYKSALGTPFFWIDDYYVTGMVFKALQIKHTPFNEAYSLNSNQVQAKFQNDTTHSLVFYHTNKIRDIYYLWRIVQQDHIRRSHRQSNFTSRVNG